MAEQAAPSTTPQASQPPHGGGRPQQGRGGRRDDRRDRAPEAPKEFEEVVINIDRVSRVVKGGRRFRFKALVVVGDRKNKVGVGVSKGADVQSAIAKATDVAKKHFITIPIKNATIPHDAEVKLAGAHVLIKPAAPGTGIIAGGVVRSVLSVTGIHNILSKSLGSTNKVNIAYATVEALSTLVPRDQWVGAEKRAEAKAKKPVEKKAVETKAVEKKTVEKKTVAKEEEK